MLGGEADLRTAASMTWHGAALDASFTEALAHRDALSPEDRAAIQRQAQQLRDAGNQASFDLDDAGADVDRHEEGRQG